MPDPLDSIFNTGLRPAEYELYDKIEPFITNDFFCLPEDADPHSFAINLALTVLERERPSQYPSHHECVFFFPSEAMTDDLSRPHTLEVADAAFTDRTLYSADYDVANDLFFETMRRMEFLNQIPVENLTDLATQYWESVTEHNTTNISGNVEIFTPDTPIDPSHLTQIK